MFFSPTTKFCLPLAQGIALPLPVGLPIGEGYIGVGCEAVWHVLLEIQLSCLCCNHTECDVTTLWASHGCYEIRGEDFCVLLILQMVKSACYCPSLLWHSKNCHQNRFCVDMVVRSGAAGGLPQYSVRSKAWLSSRLCHREKLQLLELLPLTRAGLSALTCQALTCWKGRICVMYTCYSATALNGSLENR